jgi:hypothetical protein
MRKLLSLLLFIGIAGNCASAQLCGGTERWAVKDGTDARVAQVDFTHVLPISVAQLVHLPEPRPLPNDNITRVVPNETHLYRLRVRLVKWKHENPPKGDDDYHLVLTDDTLQYTDEHAKPPIPPTFHSFVGELPNPNCLQGASGKFGNRSRYLLPVSQTPFNMATARRVFEAAFPNADYSGGWNDAGGVTVDIIGVGFFDRAHGQTGRAPNNIEIHPILAIRFVQPPPNLLAAAPWATTPNLEHVLAPEMAPVQLARQAAPTISVTSPAAALAAIAASPDPNFGSFPAPPQTEWNGDGRTMRLLKDFQYIDPSGTTWTAPANSTIDGASIPQIFWSIIGGPFEGEYRDASIVHDTECESHKHRWQDVHRMFYMASRAGGAGLFKAKIMFAAVYYFGPRWVVPVNATVNYEAVAPSGMSEDDMVRTMALIRKNPDISLDAIEGLSHNSLVSQVSDADLAQERGRLEEAQRMLLLGQRSTSYQ